MLPDDAFAVTQAKSAALLTLPDSSDRRDRRRHRGASRAFQRWPGTAQGPGATITVNNGTLRFDIRRPSGGTANYRFVTPTSGARGARNDRPAFVSSAETRRSRCLVCAADSVTVSVGTSSFAVLTGQVVTVSATGAVVSGTLTSAVTSGFSSAGVSVSTSSGLAAATAGVTTAAVTQQHRLRRQ